MSSIVNGYMNAIERETDMFDRSMQIESNKISLMVEAYYNKLENDYLMAEQKVMMENGTYDDLTYLYMEANEEADKNKETIFQKIKAFFQRIFDAIKNLFRSDEAYEGDAPKCFIDAANGSGSSEIINFFKKVGNDFKNGNVVGAIESLIKGGLTTFSVCVAIDKGIESASNVIHYPKKAYLKVKDWFSRLISELEKIESELIDAAEKSKHEKATGFANNVKAGLGKVILWARKGWEWFKGCFTGNGGTQESKEPRKMKVKGKLTGNNKRNRNGKPASTDDGSSSETSTNNDTQDDSTDDGSSSETRKMKVKGKLTGNNKRNRNGKPASTDDGSSSETSTNNDTQDDSTDGDSGSVEQAKSKWMQTNDNPKHSANAEKAMTAMKKQCQKIISTLKNYNDTLDNNDKKRIKDINKLMVNYDQKKVDPYKAFSMLYNSLDELLDILKKVGTKKQIRSCTMSTKDFKDKYVFSNDEGVIIKESYFDFDDDLYDEYTEIDDYDYDEINRIFTEYTGDPLVDELLDILDEF